MQTPTILPNDLILKILSVYISILYNLLFCKMINKNTFLTWFFANTLMLLVCFYRIPSKDYYWDFIWFKKPLL